MKITKSQLKKLIKEELGMVEGSHNTSLANSRVKATMKDIVRVDRWDRGPKYLVDIEIEDPDGVFDDEEDLAVVLNDELLIPHLRDVLGDADYTI
jgi:hypothetical protein